MKNVSTTYVAGIVTVLTLVLPLFGIEVDDKGLLTSTATQIMGILSIGYMFYGRYKAGGINAFGLWPLSGRPEKSHWRSCSLVFSSPVNGDQVAPSEVKRLLDRATGRYAISGPQPISAPPRRWATFKANVTCCYG